MTTYNLYLQQPTVQMKKKKGYEISGLDSLF